METGTPIHRRIILVKRMLQLKIVILVLAAVLAAGAAVVLDLYALLGDTLIRDLGEGRAAELLAASARTVGLHFLVFFLIAAILSVFASHKFAGPIFRVEKVTESVADGDLTVRAVFRKGDDLSETAESVNRMIESLREMLLKDKNLAERVARRIDEVGGKLASGELDPKAASELLGQVLIEVRHIGSDFRL
ncbi:MAG: hypothetical protein A2636_04875 [Elusimicrobia bacterium RIFCSPHIGHO2_01_FULL_64_10]|nr:MAG: hypothetical protein A2636_04875 [Elusimicrobia bacterium RIFCSPHIGHO2_01_FULL_64_10]